MLQARFGVPSRIERERLEFELLEVRGQYLARLVDHGLEHGCSG
jgi:hypothetical protein